MVVVVSAEKKEIKQQKAPSVEELNQAISLAQRYYEGLYVDIGNNKALIKEYYSNPKGTYTVRHGTIGGIFYYDYIGEATKSAKLKNLVEKYKFDSSQDEHSYIWGIEKRQTRDYPDQKYRDCFITLPAFKNITPYHSKVCKLGQIGVNLYMLTSRFDTFVQIQELLKKPDATKLKSLEKKYDNLGFGMPICTPISCSTVASTFRTAQFGEIELRAKNMKYADKVANNLLQAQNKDGAIYISFDANGKLKTDKPFVYTILNVFLNDKPIYNGYIPTNAETMNDSLAFLMHYRCEKYKEKCAK